MRIVHCSDIHLDSPLTSLGGRAAQRRSEILGLFCKLVKEANESADIMLIAGDLFDSSNISKDTLNSVINAFECAQNLKIYLLAGNHDTKYVNNDFLKHLPKNVFLFNETTTYDLGNVTISGFEAGREGKLVLDERKFNILLMHGDESTIDFSKYQNLPIDYVALGHYHSFSSQRFARGVLCRSGALITRGFDEIGDTGYIVLDICDDKINLNRGKIQDRRVISREIEVTHLSSSSQELLAMFDKVFADATKDDYVNVVLTGKKDINIKTDILSIKEKDYFAFRLQDDTVIKVEVDELRRSQSVQGEFVRVLDSINADETIREMALELGLEALGLEEKL